MNEIERIYKYFTILLIVLLTVVICFSVFTFKTNTVLKLKTQNQNLKTENNQIKEQISKFNQIITSFLREASQDSSIQNLMDKYGLYLKREITPKFKD